MTVTLACDWTFVNLEVRTLQGKRNVELKVIRGRYVETTVSLLQTICEKSNEKDIAQEVVETLANSDYCITQVGLLFFRHTLFRKLYV